MVVTIEKNELVIRAPISPRPSKTGKSTVIASSAGFQPTTAEYNGKPIEINLNAITKK